MKRSILYNITILFFLVVSQYSAAQERIFKEIKQTHPLGPGGVFSLENKYGDVVINGWDEDTVSIIVNVVSKGKNKEVAQELLDRIQPTITATDNRIDVVSKITKIEPSLFNKFFNRESSTVSERANSQINYELYLPRNLEVEITNKYGDVIVSDWNGYLKVDIEHGDIRLPAELERARLSINYGKLKASKIESATIIAGDANISIEDSEELRLNTKGSEVEIQNVETLSLTSNKDEMTLGSVNTIAGELKYTTLEVQQMKQRVDLTMNFSELRLLAFGSRTPLLTIDQENSDVYVNILNTAFNFEAKLEQGVLRIPKTMTDIQSEVLDEKKKIRNISANYGKETRGRFSFTGRKGVIILKEL